MAEAAEDPGLVIRLVIIPAVRRILPDWLRSNGDKIGTMVAQYVKDNADDLTQKVVTFLENQ